MNMPREEWQAHMREQGARVQAGIKASAQRCAAAAKAGATKSEAPRAGARSKDDASADDATSHRFARDQLKAFVERVEKLQEEKKAIGGDIADVYREAKGNGFDVKALREVVRLRGQDVNERKEHEAILETYLHALGMLT